MTNKPGGTLWLCGLGTRVPEETTLEVLGVLERAPVVYADDLGRAARTFLKKHCRRVVDASRLGADVPARAAAILAAARKGGAAVALWGHPALSSRLGLELLRRAGGAGVSVPAAVSPIGSAFAQAVQFFGGDYGHHAVQAYSVSDAAARAPEPGTPLVLFADGEARGAWDAAAARLAPAYPRGHRAWFFPAEGPARTLALDAADCAGRGVLFVPPAA